MRFFSKLAHFTISAALLAAGLGLVSCPSSSGGGGSSSKPRVVSVEVKLAEGSAIPKTNEIRGQNVDYQFTVNVKTEKGASADVTWSIEHFPGGGTAGKVVDNGKGYQLAAIGVAEGKGPLVITATSVFDTSKKGKYAINLQQLSSTALATNALAAVENLYYGTVDYDGHSTGLTSNLYGAPSLARSNLLYQYTIARQMSDKDEMYEILYERALEFYAQMVRGEVVYKVDLKNAVDTATQLRMDTPLDLREDAASIFYAIGAYFTDNEPAWQTFSAAITTAKNVLNNENATVEEVDMALNTLNLAITTFKHFRVEGKVPHSVDKTYLWAALTAAAAAKTDVVIASSAASAEWGKKWVTQATFDALEAASTAALSIANNANATAADVNDALTKLNDKIDAYKAERDSNAVGTSLNLNEYNLEIRIANDLLAGTKPLTGTIAQASVRSYWAPQGLIDAVNTALSIAAPTNPANLAAAISALQIANNALSAERALGQSYELVPLNEAISSTKALINATVAAANGDDLVPSVIWATAGNIATINTAVGVAEGVLNSRPSPATREYQETIDTAVETLNTARSVFSSQRHNGTKIIGSKAALNTVIINAQNRLVEVSAMDLNGLTVVQMNATISKGREWAETTDWNTLNSAITVAKGVATDDEEVNQTIIDAAAATLQTALTTFELKVNKGTLLHTSALEQRIATVQSRVNLVISYDNDVVPSLPIAAGQEWVAPTAYTAITGALTAAKLVVTNSQVPEPPDNGVTQQHVDTALANLNTAYAAFTAVGVILVKADVADLDSMITFARAEYNAMAAYESTDGLQWFDHIMWVTPAERVTLNTAINTAITARDNAKLIQSQIDNAYDVLSAALDTFVNAKKPGKRVSAASIEIVFGSYLNPGVELDRLDGFEISKNRQTSLILNISYDSELVLQYWLLNGSIYTYNGQSGVLIPMWDLPLGKHNLTVVFDLNGVPYSKTISFIVKN